MLIGKSKNVMVTQHTLSSIFLQREVIFDCYLPWGIHDFSILSLLLINDGQDLVTMDFETILQNLYNATAITPLLCVGIHCGDDRKNEYGTAKILDYKGRGAKAALYTQFIFEELLPFIRTAFNTPSFKEKAFAGFSLGALSALDIVWNNATEFTTVGVFSGSLWWRDKGQDELGFDEDKDRIMHRQIKEGNYAPWLRFYFEVGTLDETDDRNNNGIIDAIDDTTSIIDDLVGKGYNRNSDIKFTEIANGRHDVPTWAKAFPGFLIWAWGHNDEVME
jgi:enterochelin esterase-like enzyme